MTTPGPMYGQNERPLQPEHVLKRKQPLPSITKRNSGTQTDGDELSDDHEFYKELTCPISHEFMMDPLLATDGFTYEREIIEKWALEQLTAAKEEAGAQGRELEIGDVNILSPGLGGNFYLLLEADNPYTKVTGDARYKPLLIPNKLCKKITDYLMAGEWEKIACKKFKARSDIISATRESKISEISEIMKDQYVTHPVEDEEFYTYLRNFRKDHKRINTKISEIMKDLDVTQKDEEKFFAHLRKFKKNYFVTQLNRMSTRLGSRVTRSLRSSRIKPDGGSKKIRSTEQIKSKRRGVSRKGGVKVKRGGTRKRR